MITSLQNPTIKSIRKLRQARQRRQQDRILIDGFREIELALSAGVQIELLLSTPDSRPELERLPRTNSPRQHLELAPAVFEKVAFGQRDRGLVAVATPPDISLGQLAPKRLHRLLVLDRLEKPGNLGAILRTANAIGIDAVLLSDPVCDPFNPNAIRASLGAVFSTPLGSGSAAQVQTWLQQRSVRLITARVDATQAPWDVGLNPPVAIVLGSEADGLGPNWNLPDMLPVGIPMLGHVDSLNVASAAAMLMCETLRQQTRPAPLGD
jgi:RNA methyltransferase, TrmH family